MKNILTVLLLIAGCSVAVAQNKHNLFVDVGINEHGIGATYDRKLTRHFDIGAGVNTYNFSSEPHAKVRSAVYLDIRPYWTIRKSMLFLFVDIGGSYNSGPEPDSFSVAPVTLYNTLGFGYSHRINKRAMGPYASIGLYGYYETVTTSKANLSPAAREYSIEDFFGILSLGFKF